MNDIYTFAIGIVLLVLGIPIGNMLANTTEEELKSGKRWFKMVIILGMIGAITFLILGNDALLFACLFIAIVTSRSLKK